MAYGHLLTHYSCLSGRVRQLDCRYLWAYNFWLPPECTFIRSSNGQREQHSKTDIFLVKWRRRTGLTPQTLFHMGQWWKRWLAPTICNRICFPLLLKLLILIHQSFYTNFRLLDTNRSLPSVNLEHKCFAKMRPKKTTCLHRSQGMFHDQHQWGKTESHVAWLQIAF